jgi:hypothetical protein
MARFKPGWRKNLLRLQPIVCGQSVMMERNLIGLRLSISVDKSKSSGLFLSSYTPSTDEAGLL